MIVCTCASHLQWRSTVACASIVGMRYAMPALLVVFLAGCSTSEPIEPKPPLRGEALHQKAGEILQWIGQNTDYAIEAVPKIKFTFNVREIYLAQLADFDVTDEAAVLFAYKADGVYSIKEQAVYLTAMWTGRTNDHVRLLSHELVHYLQFAARKIFPCMKDYEDEADRISFLLQNSGRSNLLATALFNRRYKISPCFPPSDTLSIWLTERAPRAMEFQLP